MMTFGKPASTIDAIWRILGEDYTSEVTEEEYEAFQDYQREIQKSYQRFWSQKISEKEMQAEHAAIVAEWRRRRDTARASNAPTRPRREMGWRNR